VVAAGSAVTATVVTWRATRGEAETATAPKSMRDAKRAIVEADSPIKVSVIGKSKY
jgi:hypothetical protein